MKKRLLSLSFVTLLFSLCLVSCFPKKTDDDKKTEEDQNVVTENQVENNNQEDQQNEDETDINQFAMVELTEEIKNSDPSDQIIQIGTKVVNYGERITYGEFIEIANTELGGDIEFSSQFLEVEKDSFIVFGQYNDIYLRRNGAKCLYFDLFNDSESTIDAKDCRIVKIYSCEEDNYEMHSGYEGFLSYVSNYNDIIFAGNYCEVRDDSISLLKEKPTFSSKEEAGNYYIPNGEWITDDTRTENEYLLKVQFIHANQNTIIRLTSSSFTRDVNDGLYRCDGITTSIEKLYPDYYHPLFMKSINPVMEKDKQEHPECYIN